jgi:hypothetical protein
LESKLNAVRRKLLEFFCQPVNLECPIHGGELRGDLGAQRLRRSGESSGRSPLHQAAAYPLHPLHAAAGTTRGPNLLGGMRNHYKSVMFGKHKVFAGKIMFALRLLQPHQRENTASFNDDNVILNLWTAFC